MTTLTVKINERSNYGKAIMNLLRTSAKESNAIRVVEPEKEKSPYGPGFVKKVLKAQQEIKQGKYKVVDTNDIWGSLGL